ncbi:MAG: FAD:protein FMN transferase, partial [Polyangiaceae bacterium]
RNTGWWAIGALACLAVSCARHSGTGPVREHAGAVASASSASSVSSLASASSTSTGAVGSADRGVEQLEFQDEAMGTNVHFIAFTNERVTDEQVRSAMTQAFDEIKRLEGVLSEWRPDSEVGKINLNPEQWVNVGPDTFAVISRALEAGKASDGAFDITFQALSSLWKFGSAAEDQPKLPSKAEIEQRRKLVDYRTVALDDARHAVRMPKAHQLGLGGIAKGYIVDRAAGVLRQAGIRTFLVQAGGDLYGAGRKPDGSPWVTGIQDPRGPEGTFFATIELTDHSFSTAGDYARSYVIGKRRYHHIIDPRTGYPATACRSVTVWAPDATTADWIDDAVFIMGPGPGLELVEKNAGVGVVIVDKNNKVWVSPRVQDQVHVLAKPTDGI